MIHKNPYKHWPSRIFLLLVLAVTLNTGQAAALSEEKAAKIGKEMYDEILKKMPIFADSELNQYVTSVGEKIVRHSDQANGNFTFTIIDSPEINAFATPGGYIYINRGLLAYMNSEAELAAVLAHEVAHVTADHASRQRRAQLGSNVVAGLLAVLTGSADVGEASAMWGTATVRGYGRDMELEADAMGARFMAAAGYPTDAMINIISQLKDHERYMKKRSRESGQKVQSYHGLFSTHPRNDQRLLKIVKQADVNSRGDAGVTPFRIATDGLPWGQGTSSSANRENQYIDQRKLFSFDYPDDWNFKKQGQQIIGQPEDQSATLSLDIKARTLDTPKAFIKNQLGIEFIKKSESIEVARLKGHTGLIPGIGEAPDVRLAVLYYGRGAYVFKGSVQQGQLSDLRSAKIDESATGNAPQIRPQSYDTEFKSIYSSFRPLPRQRRTPDNAEIHYVKATGKATYTKLARQLRLGKYGADELRLINGHYPGTEPQAGQWIKIIR
ncbi:MAG TPA: peptidase M48 [Porticoccaceae bacterium]|nr:peptidase M48 [Porticoccaceae bacterium]